MNPHSNADRMHPVRAAMIDQGIGTKRLAKEAGVSVAMIGQVLRYKRVSAKTLFRLAEALDLPLETVFIAQRQIPVNWRKVLVRHWAKIMNYVEWLEWKEGAPSPRGKRRGWDRYCDDEVAGLEKGGKVTPMFERDDLDYRAVKAEYEGSPDKAEAKDVYGFTDIESPEMVRDPKTGAISEFDENGAQSAREDAGVTLETTRRSAQDEKEKGLDEALEEFLGERKRVPGYEREEDDTGKE